MDPVRTTRVAAMVKVCDLVEAIIVVVLDVGIFCLRRYGMECAEIKVDGGL